MSFSQMFKFVSAGGLFSGLKLEAVTFSHVINYSLHFSAGWFNFINSQETTINSVNDFPHNQLSSMYGNSEILCFAAP